MANRKKIIIGLSGGVDSAVAALLLKKEGHDVHAIFMMNWEEDEHCTARQDLIDAAAVADHLKIPFDVVNFADSYRENVFSDFLQEYQKGRTPNPDIWCNVQIKFNDFLSHALSLGADVIATGHYAQNRKNHLGEIELIKAQDEIKDQTYFLHRLTQKQLKKTLFPIGHLFKQDVRKVAEENKLPVFNKKDSTGICFIGERHFKHFLADYLEKQAGEIRSIDNDSLLGQHAGLMFYTIGQRSGLGIGGQKNFSESPWYVVRKELKKNILWVAQGQDHPLLRSRIIDAENMSWISSKEPRKNWVYSSKIRHQMPTDPCILNELVGSENKFQVYFPGGQWASTPGQSIVIYESLVCLGGGIIEDTENKPLVQ